MERFIARQPGANGDVICLSNDSLYWRAPTHAGATNADAFRLHDGALLSGTRAWGPHTGAGSSRGREAPLVLAGAYRLTWREYFRLPGPGGEFRALVVPVEH